MAARGLRARARGFADLAPRTASALGMGLVALAAFWAGGPWSTALVALGAALLMFESRAICGAAGGRGMLYILAVAGATSAAALGGPAAGAVVLIGFALGGAAQDRLAGRDWGWSLGFAIYFGVAAMILVAMRADPAHGFLSILWLILTVAATDTGAYFAGRMIGGPRLWPAVSPNKTWAGLVGGAVAAGLVSAAFSFVALGWLELFLPLFAMVTALVAQAGDLGESAYKRRFGVKDSGRMIPGHGGVFDRLDGLVAAALLVGAVSWARGGAPIYLW